MIQRARDAGKTRFIGYSGDGQAALFAVKSGVFDTLQISVSIADQEALDLVLPSAQAKGIGVIAKRPIANAIWKESSRPAEYYQPYWERLHQLDYDFLRTNSGQDVATALRFTLSGEGVHTAIVGTTKTCTLEAKCRALASWSARSRTLQRHPIALESRSLAGLGWSDLICVIFTVCGSLYSAFSIPSEVSDRR